MAHHVSFTFHNGHPSLESRAEKVASSILAETFVLFLRVFLLCVLVRYLARFSGFWWMDGWHHEGKIDWKGKEIGWIRCEVERKEKKKLVKGALFDFFHIFFLDREK